MRILKNCNNTAFNGYKNIVAADFSVGESKNLILAGELTDEGCRDLTEYKKISEMSRHYKTDAGNKFILMHYSSPEKSFMTLNKSVLYNGDVLNFMKGIAPAEIFKEQEAATLKAYTLFAKITKDLGVTNSSGIRKDFGIGKVIRGIDRWVYFLRHSKIVFTLFYCAFFNKTFLGTAPQIYCNIYGQIRR